MSVAFDDLCLHPTRVIRGLPLPAVGAHTKALIESVPVTHRGETIAHIRRSPLSLPAEIVAVSIAAMRLGRDERAELLRAGGSFAIERHERRIAVVEGVKP